MSAILLGILRNSNGTYTTWVIEQLNVPVARLVPVCFKHTFTATNEVPSIVVRVVERYASPGRGGDILFRIRQELLICKISYCFERIPAHWRNRGELAQTAYA